MMLLKNVWSSDRLMLVGLLG